MGSPSREKIRKTWNDALREVLLQQILGSGYGPKNCRSLDPDINSQAKDSQFLLCGLRTKENRTFVIYSVFFMFKLSYCRQKCKLTFQNFLFIFEEVWMLYSRYWRLNLVNR